MVSHYFPAKFCHDTEHTDVRKIIDKLKQIENDFQSIFDMKEPKDNEVKRTFRPYNVYQIDNYLSTRINSEPLNIEDGVREFSRETADILSEDEQPEMEEQAGSLTTNL